jgi:uncharacterized protein (TIGR02611 family)
MSHNEEYRLIRGRKGQRHFSTAARLEISTMKDIDRFVAGGVRAARRVIIAVIGSTVVLAGLALLVLPGPAFVVIPIGLAILAVEFEWARRILLRARRLYENVTPPAKRQPEPPRQD